MERESLRITIKAPTTSIYEIVEEYVGVDNIFIRVMDPLAGSDLKVWYAIHI